MKKSSKILGSVALSAALMMGTAVPAFADQENVDKPALNVDDSMTVGGNASTMTVVSDDETESKDFKAANATDPTGASTLVRVTTYTSQISVTVPLSLPVALDTAGGKGFAPEDYTIQNNSTVPVTVTGATYAINDDEKTKWTFGTIAMLDDEDPTFEMQQYATSADGKTKADPTIGSFAMKIVPQGVEGANPLNVITVGTGTKATTQSGSAADLDWEVAAGDTQKFDIDAFSSELKQEILETANTAAGIVYTVKATNA